MHDYTNTYESFNESHTWTSATASPESGVFDIDISKPAYVFLKFNTLDMPAPSNATTTTPKETNMGMRFANLSYTYSSSSSVKSFVSYTGRLQLLIDNSTIYDNSTLTLFTESFTIRNGTTSQTYWSTYCGIEDLANKIFQFKFTPGETEFTYKAYAKITYRQGTSSTAYTQSGYAHFNASAYAVFI